MHTQVLNEPKHNIKGGDISVQAAAPKSDRFNERAGGGYGGGKCVLAVYSHVCMVWISFSDTHTLGLPRARERSISRTRAHPGYGGGYGGGYDRGRGGYGRYLYRMPLPFVLFSAALTRVRGVSSLFF